MLLNWKCLDEFSFCKCLYRVQFILRLPQTKKAISIRKMNVWIQHGQPTRLHLFSSYFVFIYMHQQLMKSKFKYSESVLPASHKNPNGKMPGDRTFVILKNVLLLHPTATPIPFCHKIRIDFLKVSYGIFLAIFRLYSTKLIPTGRDECLQVKSNFRVDWLAGSSWSWILMETTQQKER